jgi:cyclic pyranopterin phosphate synthase
MNRSLRDLRISVTDRCNFRCTYCMPEEKYHRDFKFMTTDERLDFDEIVRLTRLFAAAGVRKLRITGGEPLLRPALGDLVGDLRALPGIEEIALTTTGLLLVQHGAGLKAAGLDRVTVSLDAIV